MPERFLAPRVKVCGATDAESVRAAVEAGVEAVGFVHHPPSPRSLAPERAAELVALLPPDVLPIGVLVAARPLDALAFARCSGLRALQLCGDQSPADWADFPLPILRRVAVVDGAEEEIERWRPFARAFVLDHASAPGGSGLAVERGLAARLARRAPCLLAGGLDSESVRAAMRDVRPAGVDASSRLERANGRKDPERVRAFVCAALAAWHEVHG